MPGKEAAPITFGASKLTAVLFVSLALAVNLAVSGSLGALGTWSGKEADHREKLVYLLAAGAFKALAAGSWYALAYVASPLFG